MSKLLENLIRTFLFEQEDPIETKPRDGDIVKPEDLPRYLRIINTDQSNVSQEDKLWWVAQGYVSRFGKITALDQVTTNRKRRKSKQASSKIITNIPTAKDALAAYKLSNSDGTDTDSNGFSVKINFKNEKDKATVEGEQLLKKLSAIISTSSTFGIVSGKSSGNHIFIVSNNINDGDRRQLYNVWIMPKSWMDTHNIDEILKIAGTDVYNIGSSKMIQWSTMSGIASLKPAVNKFTTEEITAFDKINNSESAIAAAAADIKNDISDWENYTPEDNKNLQDVPKVDTPPADDKKPSDDKKPVVNEPVIDKPSDDKPQENPVKTAKKLVPGVKVSINKPDKTPIDYYTWNTATNKWTTHKGKFWAMSTDDITYVSQSVNDKTLSLIKVKEGTKYEKLFVKTSLLKVK